jgi:hypothetical protein
MHKPFGSKPKGKVHGNIQIKFAILIKAKCHHEIPTKTILLILAYYQTSLLKRVLGHYNQGTHKSLTFYLRFS